MELCIGQFLGNLGDLGFLQLKSRKQPKLLLKLPGLPLLPFSRPFWKFLQQSQSVSLPRGFAGFPLCQQKCHSFFKKATFKAEFWLQTEVKLRFESSELPTSSKWKQFLCIRSKIDWQSTGYLGNDYKVQGRQELSDRPGRPKNASGSLLGH